MKKKGSNNDMKFMDSQEELKMGPNFEKRSVKINEY